MGTAKPNISTSISFEEENGLPSHGGKPCVPLTPPQNTSKNPLFEKVWAKSTEDNNIALYGFRRFKTSHLVNLRFLEEEIAKLDHDIYQIGLKSANRDVSGRDRLGFRFSKRDSNVPEETEFVIQEMILKLRSLLKEYGIFLTIITF